MSWKKAFPTRTDLRKLPRIIFKKLGQHQAHGMAMAPEMGDNVEPTIYIDETERGRHRLYVILHEAAHIAAPGLGEEMIVQITRYQAMVAHHLGYRVEDAKEDPDA